ncbi:MAG: NTP transferase domain-containing protein [Nitrososphaerota archaeon]|jgi:molybdopterin-guanine dinucleotide biosynthesis protein A|nr:NTP transferase domain-containing protein [Nitrososphaerota archaeon]
MLDISSSAVILAGGNSKGFSDDKGALLLGNKALIRYVFDVVDAIVDEVIIATDTQERADRYAKLLPKTVKFVINSHVDQDTLQGSLKEAIAGFKAAKNKYTLLVSYDAPFINEKLVQFLLDLAIGKTAAVVRTPDNNTECLCAVYQTKVVLETVNQAIMDNNEVADLQGLVEKLRGVRYISMSVIEQIDPMLQSFFTINTPVDLKQAKSMLERKQHH